MHYGSAHIVGWRFMQWQGLGVESVMSKKVRIYLLGLRKAVIWIATEITAYPATASTLRFP